MPGRDYIPGESSSYNDHRNHEQYHNRFVRGQITSVTPEDGKAQVSTVELMGTRDVTVPVLWFSANGSNSSWGRFMPFGNENVEIAYRNDDSPVIVGYNANSPRTKGEAGWPVLREFQEAGDVPGFQTFRPLARGEFDFKSSGDAYILGTQGGSLLLAGGQAFIRLDKQNFRARYKAALHQMTAEETSEMRFGTVYRKLFPSDVDEVPVNQGAFKEFLVDVNQPLPSGTPSPQSRAKIHFGDILDPSTNVPETSADTGQPLRGRISIGDAVDAQEVFKLEIDQLGNIIWDQNAIGVTGFKARASNFTFVPDLFINLGAEQPTDFAALALKVLNELNLVKIDFAAFRAWVVVHAHFTTATIGPSAAPGMISVPITAAAHPVEHSPASVASSIVKVEP